jgi:hypothetical protein
MDLDLTPNPIQPDEASIGYPGYPEVDPIRKFPISAISKQK